MKFFLLLSILIGCRHCSGAIFSQELEQQSRILGNQIQILEEVLFEECRDWNTTRNEVPEKITQVSYDAQKQLYSELQARLIECRKANGVDVKSVEAGNTTTAPDTTIATTTAPDTTIAAIVGLPEVSKQAMECQTATNYNQSWRLDHNGSNLRAKGPHSSRSYACDWYSGSPWFRFTGAAGNQMLNKFPKYKSCGTLFPAWTDQEMPKEVGVIKKVDVHTVLKATKIKTYKQWLLVMRCSNDTDHDFVYKLVGWKSKKACRIAFCGML